MLEKEGIHLMLIIRMLFQGINLFRQIFLLVVLMLIVSICLLSGCTYYSKLGPASVNYSDKTKQLPYTLAIDGRNMISRKAIASPGMIILTVEYGDGFLDTLNNKLKESFNNTYIIRTDSDLSNYDYIVSLDDNILSECFARCDLTSVISVRVNNNEVPSKILFSNDLTDKYIWFAPTSVKVMSVLTGLTLGIIAPITVPIMLELDGEEFLRQVSLSNDRITTKLCRLLTDGIVNAKNTKTKDLMEHQKDVYSELIKLDDLRKRGIISESEFAAQKKKLLNGN